MGTRFWCAAAACALAILSAGCEGGAARKSTLSEASAGAFPAAGFSSPEDALALAKSLTSTGAYGQALSVLAEAHSRFPAHGGIASAYGRLALTMGDGERAGPLLDQALAADPQDWRALSARAILDARRGFNPRARETLRRAEGLSSQDPAILNNLGVAHLIEGEASKAAALFRKALVSPDLKSAHRVRIKRNLAVALAVMGDFETADRLAGEKMPRELRGANPDDVAELMGLGAPMQTDGSWTPRLAEAGQDQAPPRR